VVCSPSLLVNLWKGGNCLRKVYFADTRFSEGLNFTARRPDVARHFAQEFPTVCRAVAAAAGIAFDLDRVYVKEKETPDRDCQAVEGRLYFRGPCRSAATIFSTPSGRRRFSNKFPAHTRDVEPYSFRYKVTRSGEGAEYFYGFDRSRDQPIKSFFLHKIKGVSMLPQTFQPRWEVEF
jgi:hypothetical protein